MWNVKSIISKTSACVLAAALTLTPGAGAFADAEPSSKAEGSVLPVSSVQETAVPPENDVSEAEAAPAPAPAEAEEPAAEETAEKPAEDPGEQTPPAETDSRQSAEPDQPEVPIPDGTYIPDAFVFSGGTGKVTIACPSVTMEDGGAAAEIFFSSPYFDQLKAGGKTYTARKNGGGSLFTGIPAEVNQEFTITARTTAMSEPHWISYQLKITLSKDSKPGRKSAENQKKPDVEERKTSRKKSFKNGTWLVLTEADYSATGGRGRMFHIAPDKKGRRVSRLVKKDDRILVTLTLTGTGYDYLCLGSAKKAAKAPRSSWIHYKQKNHFYTYTFSLPAADREIPIAARSKKYKKWYDHTILIRTAGARRVKAGEADLPARKTAPARKRSASAAKAVSSRAVTAPVGKQKGLKDGTYPLDSFSWSGGSGRLAYIRASKAVVRGGRAYVTIEFASSHYDMVKAGGAVYRKAGGGNSRFTIPVKLNANNTIIGRTTAMSAPHWIAYSIYPACSKAAGKTGAAAGSKKTKLSSKKLAAKAPVLTGLTFQKEAAVRHAKLFKIWKYQGGVTLIQVDARRYLTKKEKEEAAAVLKAAEKKRTALDEEGNPIGETPPEIAERLYKKKIINYLVVPEKFDLPAGLDKTCIIIRRPADRIWAGSKAEEKILRKMKKPDLKITAGSWLDPDYPGIVTGHIDIASVDGNVLTRQKKFSTLRKRFAALEIPLLIDRSRDEKSKEAKKEWKFVYQAVFG